MNIRKSNFDFDALLELIFAGNLELAPDYLIEFIKGIESLMNLPDRFPIPASEGGKNSWRIVQQRL